jgi:beta-phosphoglucomutase-like phosphatase (HAD superfamily)
MKNPNTNRVRSMTNPLAATVPVPRRLACARCGTEFGCTLSGDCWCGEESARLPLPTTGTGFADCLCRDCLRAIAAEGAPRWEIGAVLLDMDGTLIDTERVYRTSLASALADLGYADGLTIAHAMIGLPAVECELMLFEHYGANFRIDELRRAFVSYKDDMLREGLPSSSRRGAEEHLTLAGIRSRFDTIVTHDDVVRGKPDPALYLLGADRLGFRPQLCVAIEDSTPGIAAAHGAGTIPIMVPDMVQPNDETRTKCAAVLPDLHAALTMLRERGAFGASRLRD